MFSREEEPRNYKGLAYMIMEADKSYGLLLASWRPRRAGGVSSSLKAGRLKTQEEPMFRFKSDGQRKTSVSVQGSQAGEDHSYLAFLFYSVLQLFG